MKKLFAKGALAAVSLSTLLLTGCASNQSADSDVDPIEPVNRAIYVFNDTIDVYALKPVSQAYQNYLPSPVQTATHNFFNNLNDVNVALNSFLQGKMEDGVNDTGRFIFNTTFGLAGLIDIATPMGFEKHDEDFGQTLGHYGIGTGAYVVLPLLGPSNVRDGLGKIADFKMDPVSYVDPERDRWLISAYRAVDTRANLLEETKIRDEQALDPYTFTRDAFLQNREHKVYDGNPPVERPDF